MTKSFGRRPADKPARPAPMLAKISRPASPAPQALPALPAGRSVDDEIKHWKKARGSNFPIKLLALVASVSFGIASIALPKEINDWAEYPLYVLSAASLYAGFARRKRKQAT